MRKIILSLAIASVLLGNSSVHAQPAVLEDTQSAPLPTDPLADDEGSPFRDDVPDPPAGATTDPGATDPGPTDPDSTDPGPMRPGPLDRGPVLHNDYGCNDLDCQQCNERFDNSFDNGFDNGNDCSGDGSSDCSCDGCCSIASENYESGCSWDGYRRGEPCDNCDPYGSIWDDPEDCCDTPSHAWIEVDYLQWWIQGYAIPDLVTSAPLGSSGASNDPNAVTIIGSDRLDGGTRSGARGRIGWWFDCCETHGIQAEFFGFEREGTRFDGVSNPPGSILWRPFFDADPGVLAPNAQEADAISVASSSELYSANALYRHNWKCDYDECGCRGYRVDFLAGYRHLRLNEELAIYETASFAPSVFDIEDRFHTDNRFDGGEIGVVGRYYRDDWSFELLAKIALGNNHQTVRVFGEEITTTPPGPPTIRNGGLLAQPTNIRSETRNEFAVLPELNAEVGYLLTDNFRLTFGYTFLWLSRAVRPGDQIDPVVDGRFLNPNLVPPFVPPATRPAPRFTPSSLWAQGLNAGLEWRY